MIRIRSPQDLGAALIFLVIGVAGIALGTKLPGMKADGQLGSGTMPYILSWICIGFSALMLFRALSVNGPPMEAVPWRALIGVSVAVVVFGALIEVIGYLPTAMITPLVAAFAIKEQRWFEAIFVAVFLGCGTTVLFITLLGQPMKYLGGAN